jgi:pheromone shutdown protein TraB
MDSVGKGGSRIFVLPVIRGLVSEAEEVERAIEETRPDALGICVSKEELKTLGTLGDQEAEPSSAHEEAYMKGLQKFGDVRKPPPCYSECIAVARRLRVPCMAVDMDESLYTEAYCNFVSVVDVMKQTKDSRVLSGKKFEGQSPGDFVLEFDAYVNRHRGFERLEQERERYIALRLSKMADKWSRVLSLIEVERADGVLKHLELLLPL